MDYVVEIEYSPEVLADFCGLWNIPVSYTEENPELALQCLNGLWGIPMVPGPQSARRPLLNALGRTVGDGFQHSYSEPFKNHFGTLMGQIQAWPVLHQYFPRLLRMSEAQLIEHYDGVKQFFDRHAGIAAGLGTVGALGAMRGQTPAQIAEAIGRRALAGGDSLTQGGLDRIRQTVGERIPRFGERATQVGNALRTPTAGAFGLLIGVVYVATIGEAYDKLSDIRAVAAIKYRNQDLSEEAFRHILDLHPTDVPPELYFE